MILDWFDWTLIFVWSNFWTCWTRFFGLSDMLAIGQNKFYVKYWTLSCVGWEKNKLYKNYWTSRSGWETFDKTNHIRIIGHRDMLDDKYWTAGWAVGKQGLAVSAAKSVFLVSALRATSDLMMVMVMVVIMGIVFICLYLLNICLFVICPILTKTTVTISVVPGGANIQLPIQKAASTTTVVRSRVFGYHI